MRASTRIRGISGSAKRCRGLPRRWAWTSRPLSPEIDCDSALAFCLGVIFSEDRFPLFPIMLRESSPYFRCGQLRFGGFCHYIGFIIAALSIRVSLALARLCLINLADRRR